LDPWNELFAQHCLDKWILPNLGNRLLSEVGNGALRYFVEILSVAGLAPKTIINVVVVVKMVVASAVNEEGDKIYPRAWNHEFIHYRWSSKKSRIVLPSHRKRARQFSATRKNATQCCSLWSPEQGFVSVKHWLCAQPTSN
jgi:hypothetical protein